MLYQAVLLLFNDEIRDCQIGRIISRIPRFANKIASYSASKGILRINVGLPSVVAWLPWRQHEPQLLKNGRYVLENQRESNSLHLVFPQLEL